MALLQGFYKPQNPQKYKGDIKQIVYRSSYELSFLTRLDNDKDVIQYSSEEVIVPYRDPVDKRLRRYFCDFYVKRKLGDKIVEQLIEIKPYVQTIPPVLTGTKKKKKTLLNEVYTFALNQAKWDAARTYCARRGWEFIIMTEKELGIGPR